MKFDILKSWRWSCHLCSTTSGRVSMPARGNCSPAIRKINPDAESYARVMPARGKCSPAIRKINPDAESYARVMPD
ncbi:hypothetical protein AVEN_81638-1 [Araneus ventricosus]|uniref:Uncharacterized protein n=1 Tax=Araneus ventricosus TaxID=182803 RepID=A0A4Y2STZ8_ARAVE|nr:hypothetical protein AVEN_81638-1 [Araneus ventricosus]